MRSCTVRSRQWYGESARVQITPTKYECDCHEEDILLDVEDSGRRAFANLPIRRARRLFKAGLQMCDEIEAEEKEKKCRAK